MTRSYFNPHSREGSDVLSEVTGTIKEDFNPHSREGSDSSCIATYKLMIISIHTPAKGVTHYGGRGIKMCDISIHTPAKGVTILQGNIPCS